MRAPLLAATVPFLAALAAARADADEVQRILILYSNESFLPANIAVGNAFVGHMRAEIPGRAEFFSEFLDLVRFSGEEHELRTVAALRAKYDGQRMDLIVVAGPQALELLAAHRDALFPGVPLVFTGVRAERLAQHKPGDATGILMRLDPAPTLELALRLQPETQRVVVVTGASDFDRGWESVARDRFRDYEGRLEFEYLSALPMPQLLARLRALGPGTVVIYLSIFNDGAGEYFIAAEAAPLVAEASAAPVYGLYDTYLGSGIVGGRMDTFELVGRETARLALRVLAGERPDSIAPYFPGDGVTVVDWRQLRRWGLDEGLLPPGTEVRYRQPSLWDRYRAQILAGVGLLVLQTAVIAGLIVSRLRRLRAEQSLRASRSEARRLAGRLISAQEDERRRLARELHDDLSQRLAAAAIEAGKLEHQLPQAPAMREVCTQLKDDLIALSDDVHHISRQIHPAILEDLGLEVALRSECDRTAERNGTSVALQCGGVPADLPRPVSLCLYRIAQEALWNAVRHASTDRIEVFLGADIEGVHLEVRDFGRGFDPAVAGDGGLGLASMKERARLVGGRLAITSRRGAGATVTAHIPLSERDS